MLAGKDFITKAIGEIKESARGPQNPAQRLQGKEQCSKISKRHCVGEAMLDVWGRAMCATNTGCCKVPFKLLSLLPSVNRIKSGHLLLLQDISFQFRECGDGYI